MQYLHGSCLSYLESTLRITSELFYCCGCYCDYDDSYFELGLAAAGVVLSRD